MTQRTQILSIALTLFIAISATSRAEQASDTASTKADDNLAAEFKDKIVMLEVNRSSAMETKSTSVTIQNARISKIGARYFVLGNGYVTDDSDYTWYKDVTVGVPWENIVRFQAFSTEQFAEYCKQWKEHSKD